MGRGLSVRGDTGFVPLGPRQEGLSAVRVAAGYTGGLVVPFWEKRRLETNFWGRLLSSLAKSIRG